MVCACLAMLPPACALSRGIKGSALWRLRGGDAIDDGGADGGGRLSHEDIEAKLNRVPTFCLVNADDQFVRMPGKDSIEEVIFFIDAAEAIEALELNRAGNPEAELRLATLPLGAAFTACGGWPDEPPRGAHYVLRGARAAVTAKGDEARAQLKAMGLNAMAESEWVLPLFMCDEFQTPQMMPLFFSEADFEAGWARAGHPPDEALFLVHTVMDLRALVVNMAHSDAMPWARFMLVASEASYELAQQIAQEVAERQTDAGE